MYDNVYKAYLDVYILQEIENYNKSTNNNMMACFAGVSLGVLGHICELVKYDLALIIWKIYLDKDDRALTLVKLKNWLIKIEEA